MFGISGPEILVISVVLLVIMGPSRLPEVTSTLTKWVKNARVQLTKLRANLDGEMGEDLRNLDLSVLNVRQYDPRNIIRQAVQEEMEEWRQLVNPLAPAKKTPTGDSAAHNTSEVTTTAPPSSPPPAATPATPAPSVGPGSVVQPAAGEGRSSRVQAGAYRAATRDEAIAAWFSHQRKRRGFGSRAPQLSHRARVLRQSQKQ